MARRERRVKRYPDEFRGQAMARVRGGEQVVAVARELDVHPRLVHSWLAEARRAEGGEPRRPPLSKDLEGLRRENQQLKQALADKTLELDFFKGALQKVRARHQGHDATGATASTPRSGR